MAPNSVQQAKKKMLVQGGKKCFKKHAEPGSSYDTAV